MFEVNSGIPLLFAYLLTPKKELVGQNRNPITGKIIPIAENYFALL